MKILSFIIGFFLLPLFASSQNEYTVYLFLLDDCPVTQSYTLKLKDLHTEFGKDFSFIGVFPNHSSTEEKIKKFVEEYEIPFPVQDDYDKKLVKQFGVRITPEVVVYNPNKDRTVYRGRIDNEFADLGKRRRVVTTDELKEVLIYLTSGKEKVFTFTEAIGCMINQNDPKRK